MGKFQPAHGASPDLIGWTVGVCLTNWSSAKQTLFWKQTPLSTPLLRFTPPLSFCVALWKRNYTLYWNGFNIVVSHRCFAATFDHWPQQFHSEKLVTWLYSFCVTGDKKWLMRSTHHLTQTVLTGRSSWVITSSQPTDPFPMPGTCTKERNHSELVTSVSGLLMEKKESAVGGIGWKALIICSSYWGFNDSTAAVELLSTVTSVSWRVCIALIIVHVRHQVIVKWAALVHSHIHTHSCWDHWRKGAGLEGAAHSRHGVLEARWSFNFFLLPRHEKVRQNTLLFPCQSIWSIGSKPSEGFVFVFSAIPCQHAPPSDLPSFIAGNKMTNERHDQPQILTNCLLLTKKKEVCKVCGWWCNSSLWYFKRLQPLLQTS